MPNKMKHVFYEPFVQQVVLVNVTLRNGPSSQKCHIKMIDCSDGRFY